MLHALCVGSSHFPKSIFHEFGFITTAFLLCLNVLREIYSGM